MARKAGTTRTTTKPTAEAPQRRNAQQRASSEQRQSQKKERQAKSSKSSSSASKQGATGSSKLTNLLGSPVVRNVLAASLVSAAAALIYRKPKAITEAGEHVQDAASELMDGAVDAVRATSKTARKVRQKAAAAVQAVASPSATSEAKLAQRDGSSIGDVSDAAAGKRKRRSDAGVRRASPASLSKAGAPISSAPEASPPLANLHETETSAFALGSAPAKANLVLDSADGAVVEADPSYAAGRASQDSEAVA